MKAGRRSSGLRLLCALLLAGCAAPQEFETYRYQAASVTAYRYAGDSANFLNEIRIDLGRAKPFWFHFPNGDWISSRRITRDLLLAHGIAPSLETREGKSLASWQAARPLSANLAGRHKYFTFTLDAHGQAIELTIAACGYRFDELLRPLDQQQTYGFPLSIDQAEELFGPAEKREHIFIITGFSCL